MNLHILKIRRKLTWLMLQRKKRKSRKCPCFSKILKTTFEKITLDNSPKGEIFNTARLAGTMAAKKTDDLIPLCHNINLNSIEINFRIIKKNLSLKF